MEKATIIRLTLDEARELYNSNNETLMGLALQAFPEDVLNSTPFNKIKSFEDAITVLGMDVDDENYTVNTLKERSKAMAAMYKLNIIRKALNLEQNLHLIKVQMKNLLFIALKTHLQLKDLPIIKMILSGVVQR